MTIVIKPKTVLIIFLSLILILLFANTLGLLAKFYFDHDYVYGLVPFFDFGKERNLPTFYSSCALMLASLLLFFVAFVNKKLKYPFFAWLGLAIVFLFLSVDEITQIHEYCGKPFQEAIGSSVLMSAAWVVPYGLALIAFMISYLKFLIRLPRETAILFVLSGFIFVSGAIGFEALSGMYCEAYGKNAIYSMLYSVEEFLEMIGIVIFIFAILRYMVAQFRGLNIKIMD